VKIKSEYEWKNNNILTLEEFKDKNYGIPGIPKRHEPEAGYENFKIGALMQDARIERGMMQQKLEQ